MMATNIPVDSRQIKSYESKEGLDVDWLLHSKRDFSCKKENGRSQKDVPSGQPAVPEKSSDPTVNSALNGASSTQNRSSRPSVNTETARNNASNDSLAKHPHTTSTPVQRQDSLRKESLDDPRHGGGRPGKKEGRRSSWITSISNKLSGGSTAKTHNKSPSQSPASEVSNPFDKGTSDAQSAHENDEPPMPVPSSPRRPSVLVAAGTELKVDQPGFLTSALRRLSSGTAANLGKGAGSGALCPRKVMNVDLNRDRSKVSGLEQNKLKRVAFCVDVEIAGVASHADEVHTHVEPVGTLPKSSASPSAGIDDDKKDAKSAKYKEKGEGAALKNPHNASQEKEQLGQTKVDKVSEIKEEQREESQKDVDEKANESIDAKAAEPGVQPMTRKKEKKKRSEAERKERRERKRRHAEANGLIPLELTRDDDDSDTTNSTSTPGTSTPRKSADQPTTDPLRIYKRCCQLRETTAQTTIKDQISKPAATLAEAPGTVSVIDLSGCKLALQDVVTFADWLAVVPVRKLVLNDCNLSDEAVRVILSGLLSCKTSSQARHNRKLPKYYTGKHGQEQMGCIEKLLLKNNTNITNIGWKHIALFLHMSRSLRAIDLTGIPYPKTHLEDTLSRTSTNNSTMSANGANGHASKTVDVGSLIARAIAERAGTALEELIVSGCNLSSSNVADLVNAAIRCRLRRLGLAANNLSAGGLEHVVRYIQSGVCEGLDLGSNDLHNTGKFLTEALDEKNPLFALSLADCNLAPDDLVSFVPRLTTLSNFKFVDFSRNHGLFSGSRTAVPLMRKYLPKMRALKRIHLADVDLQPDHIISIAEVLPDCRSLCHVNILENESLVRAMNSKSAGQQEEATAFLASLMTAVRVSKTIIAIEFEVPSAESSEVVKALASQVLAYSLRNMERSALSDMGVASSPQLPDKDAPEVLLHLVGHMEGYTENHDFDEPAPDEDYIIASTGIVKALGVCLRNQDSRAVSRNISPAASGTVTPRQSGMLRPMQQKKPKDVGRELCEAARKIRMRLRPALVKEDRLGNIDAYRRLAGLDGTLERLIQRFEDEYPDTIASDAQSPYTTKDLSTSPPDSDVSRSNSISESNNRTTDESLTTNEDAQDDYMLKLSQTVSNTSLAGRALSQEEGRMHRFGQSFRRDILDRTEASDAAADDDYFNQPSEEAFTELRRKIEHIKGEEIRARVEQSGPDSVIKQLGLNSDELKAYRLMDPEAFEMLRESQMVAKMNASLTRNRPGSREGSRGGSPNGQASKAT